MYILAQSILNLSMNSAQKVYVTVPSFCSILHEAGEEVSIQGITTPRYSYLQRPPIIPSLYLSEDAMQSPIEWSIELP